jgi:hypothetical protein
MRVSGRALGRAPREIGSAGAARGGGQLSKKRRILARHGAPHAYGTWKYAASCTTEHTGGNSFSNFSTAARVRSFHGKGSAYW